MMIKLKHYELIMMVFALLNTICGGMNLYIGEHLFIAFFNIATAAFCVYEVITRLVKRGTSK